MARNPNLIPLRLELGAGEDGSIAMMPRFIKA
jgi:hypothetical protein